MAGATADAVLLAVGQRVLALRKELGWSQEELAEHSDLHRTYVSSLENGGRNVSILGIMQLARALNVDPGELFAGVPYPRRRR